MVNMSFFTVHALLWLILAALSCLESGLIHASFFSGSMDLLSDLAGNLQLLGVGLYTLPSSFSGMAMYESHCLLRAGLLHPFSY